MWRSVVESFRQLCDLCGSSIKVSFPAILALTPPSTPIRGLSLTMRPRRHLPLLSRHPVTKVSVEFKPTDESSRFSVVPSTGDALRLVRQVGVWMVGMELQRI